VKRAAVALWLGIAVLLIGAIAGAHSRPLSYSMWRVLGADADVQVQIAESDLAILGLSPDGPLAGRAGAFLEENVRMDQGGSVCLPLGAAVRAPALEPWTVWRWSVHCAKAGPPRISAGFVSLLQSGHRHMVRLDEGGKTVERMLDVSTAAWFVDPGLEGESRTGSTLLDYLLLGIEHLLTGWDHMAFLLALLVLTQRLRDVVGLVTSFTVAHSITLALAATHVVEPDPQSVEALIGFSIALLGAENVWLLSGGGRVAPILAGGSLLAMALLGGGRVSRVALVGLFVFVVCHFSLLRRFKEPARSRVAIAFAFGLIHGFGFAGAMALLHLPATRLAPALLGFNVGVEVGQLGFVLALWPLLRMLSRVRGGRLSRLFNEVSSAAVFGLGLFWCLVRARG
jgi:HupE / UreJ protein